MVNKVSKKLSHAKTQSRKDFFLNKLCALAALRDEIVEIV